MNIEFNEQILKDYIKYNPFMINVGELFSGEHLQKQLENNNFSAIFENYYYSSSEHTLIAAVLILSNIDFLSHLKTIPKFCFSGLPITKIEIPSNIKQISSWAFNNCNILKEVILPDSIVYMDSGIFAECINLKELNYLGTRDDFIKLEDNSSLNWNGFSNITSIKCSDQTI